MSLDTDDAGSPPSSPYAGETIALLTQHGKENILSPRFKKRLGAQVVLARGVDTDTLGTFTREIPRRGHQLDAATHKARLALMVTGARMGLGSEGSFGPGAFGIGAWNLELIVLHDAHRGLDIVGRSYAPTLHTHALVTDVATLHEAARAAGFPAHGLALRPDHEGDPRIVKGIVEEASLERAFQDALRASSTGTVFVENDFRAHVHPTRRTNIAAAAIDLLTRASCLCEACGAPGFGAVGTRAGLRCADCGTPTAEPVARELGCVACPHREIAGIAEPPFADPLRCGRCNP